MAKSILQTNSDPLSYKRTDFNAINLKKPAAKKVSVKPAKAGTKYSRITHKPMGSNPTMSEIPVNASKQPKGTVFGSKIQ